MHIDLKNLFTDETVYPRVKPSWREILRYSMALKLESKFPPIHVGKAAGQYIVIDGVHRVEAYRKVGRQTIGAFLVKLPRSDWFLEAVRLNAVNGIPLTYSERLRAAMRLQNRQIPMDQIARIVTITTDELQAAIAERGFYGIDPDQPVIVKQLLLPRVKERGRKWTQEHASEIAQLQQTLHPNQGIQSLVQDLAHMVSNDFLPSDDETLVMVKRLTQLLSDWLAKREQSKVA